MHLRETAHNQPCIVFVETPICIPLGDKDPLARNQITPPRDKAPLEHTNASIAANSFSIAALHSLA